MHRQQLLTKAILKLKAVLVETILNYKHLPGQK